MEYPTPTTLPVGTLVRSYGDMQFDVYRLRHPVKGLHGGVVWLSGSIGVTLRSELLPITSYFVLWSTGDAGWSYDYVLDPV